MSLPGDRQTEVARAPRDKPMPETQESPFLAPHPVRLLDIRLESPDSVSLVIEPPPGYPSWCPGQFNMLYLWGRGEVAISISGDDQREGARGALIHTVKGVGPVTQTMLRWRTPREADGLLYLRGPFGSAWPQVAPGQDLLLIGGGIGLAPLRPVIRSYLAESVRRRLLVLYGMKRPQDALFQYEWPAWNEGWDVHFVLSSDQPAPGWEGEVGHVTSLIPRLEVDPGNTVAMICGPEIMMRAATVELGKAGVLPRDIYVSMERHMKCAVALCGRCQWGPHFVCRDGPIFRMSEVAPLWDIPEF